jgi:hypothetical protein
MTENNTLTPAELTSAVQTLEWLTVRLGSLSSLAPKIRELASLLGATSEQRVRLDALRAAADEIEARRTADIAAADAAAKRLAGLTAELAAHDEKLRILHVDALGRASGESDRRLAEARAEVERIVAAGHEKLAADAMAKAASDAAGIKDRERRLSDLDTALAVRQASLDAVTAAIAHLRDKIG